MTSSATHNAEPNAAGGGSKITLTVDGRVIEATKGDSIAAAMLAAGEYRFREQAAYGEYVPLIVDTSKCLNVSPGLQALLSAGK